MTGKVRRRHPVEVEDVKFLRANTDRMIKMTVPGPFTMSQQAQNDYYPTEEAVAMAYADAVNAEIRDLFAATKDASVTRRLARLAGRSDQDVMTYMTIPATISGGPSIFQVRIGSGEVLSAGDEADFLVAFYQHSYQDHIGFLREGGVLLYDSDNVEPNLDDKRFVYVGVPITGLTVEALGGTAKDKGKNIFVLGLISKIFNLDDEKLKRLITEKFGGKKYSFCSENCRRHFQEDPRIAYFSMEIGISSTMPTYSGGLGVLAGDIVKSSADLRLVSSRAFLAASRAWNACRALSMIMRASEGFSSKKSSRPSPTRDATMPCTSLLPSFVLVWPSN